jgi:hypothetical protein
MLAFEVAQSTISKYMARPSKLPSQPWKTFLRNHAEAIAAIDVCVVLTLTFDLSFAFVVLGHGRRQHAAPSSASGTATCRGTRTMAAFIERWLRLQM